MGDGISALSPHRHEFVTSRPKAQVVWVAMLGHSIYNYAYYLFGAEFNDVFLLHIAILSMGLVFALDLALLAPALVLAEILLYGGRRSG